MTINGKISYHKALVLTPERISELEAVLKKHCDKITYEATTVSGVEIAFENVDELLDYENFEKKRIKDLTVIGYKGYSRVYRITFEYSLVAGVNDTKEDAKELVDLIKGMNCHVNLIPVNPIKERDYKQSNKEQIQKFRAAIEKSGISATVRREMGRDIDGACGQLRRKHINKQG